MTDPSISQTEDPTSTNPQLFESNKDLISNNFSELICENVTGVLYKQISIIYEKNP
jgi:hypothetical protein